MSREAEKVLEDGLRLPPQARAAVASQLIESLDEGVDENAEAEWSAEIARRLKELDSGSVRAIPWEQARRDWYSARNEDPFSPRSPLGLK